MLAAIDGGPVSQPVLAAAIALAEQLAGQPDVVHVDEGRVGRAVFHAEVVSMPLHTLRGDPAEEILAASRAPEIGVLVIGARNKVLATNPLGSVAERVLIGSDRPVLIVPPQTESRPPATGIGRVLQAVASGPTSDHPILAALVASGAKVQRIDVSGTSTVELVEAVRHGGVDLVVMARHREPHDVLGRALRSVVAVAPVSVLLLPVEPR